jgi:glycosyltransferase involved in cell wall biosynthesis
MNIGIDIRRTRGQITGVGVYLVKFVEALNRIDRENRYFYFLGEEHRRGPLANPYFLELVWKQLVTPAQLARRRIDVFFVPNPPACFPATCPTVLMIPDMACCVIPSGSRASDLMSKMLYRLSARKADRVVTISEWSRRDIRLLLGIPEERVDIVPLACDEIFRPRDRAASQRETSARFGLRGKYILAVPGTLIPRKGTIQLLDAFARLPETLRREHQLLVVAKQHPSAHAEFLAQAAARGLPPGDVVVTGYVSHAELPPIYAGAELLAYPSQYEGFGLPPLEAMACGTPVIAANTTSVPEVVGAGGILIDPLDADALSSAMARVLSEMPLRDELRERGMRRAADFSWDRSAARLLESLRQTARPARR